jgi:hypothetical protein
MTVSDDTGGRQGQDRRRKEGSMPGLQRIALKAAVSFLIGLIAGAAQASPYTPAPGSQERRQILDTARMPAEKALGKPVKFLVRWLRVQDGWTFLHAQMLGPDGKPIGYEGTRYQGAAEHGLKSNAFDALLERKGGAWLVVTYRIGPTDVAWLGWDKQYHAPAAIFLKVGK